MHDWVSCKDKIKGMEKKYDKTTSNSKEWRKKKKHNGEWEDHIQVMIPMD